jgi:hypothetical protein
VQLRKRARRLLLLLLLLQKLDLPSLRRRHRRRLVNKAKQDRMTAALLILAIVLQCRLPQTGLTLLCWLPGKKRMAGLRLRWLQRTAL